jgi:hypothetical protein
MKRRKVPRDYKGNSDFMSRKQVNKQRECSSSDQKGSKISEELYNWIHQKNQKIKEENYII